MPAFVRETVDGWEVVEGDVVTAHDSLVSALDAALSLNGGKTKDAILRDPDTKDPNGAWRWLHATDVEDVPAYDGARIDETTVSQAVASLNGQPLARPVNGMTADSEGHGSAGQTLANGYVHHGVEVVAADGRRGAYVLAELLPDIARNVDSGRIAYTSIGLGGTVSDDGDGIRDAYFDHLALTNTPAVTTLTPSSAIRKAGDRLLAMRSRIVRAASPKGKAPPMTVKTSVRSEIVKPLALRGAALDALTVLCTSLGVDLDTEMTADEWDSPAKAALCALRQIAKAERIVEGLTGQTLAAARSARAGIVKRAEVADADLEALAKAVGLEAGASMADILAAVAEMEHVQVDGAAKKAPADDAAMKSETEATRALRAEVSVLRSATENDRKELEKLRAESVSRSNEAWLDGQVKIRRLALRAEDRAELLSILVESPDKGRSLVEKALATRSAPTVGTVIHNDGVTTDPLAEGGTVTDPDVATSLALSALRSEGKLSGSALFTAAAAKARTDHPAAFAARTATR